MPLNPKKIALTKDTPFVRKIAIHSPSGGGKTRLSATAQDVPALADVYLLDADAGTATLQSRGDIDAEETRRAIDVERVLMAFVNKEAETLRYKTVVVDGLSALLQREFEELVKGKDATWKEYGRNKSLGIRLLQLIRDLPVTTIVNVWTKELPGLKPGTQQEDENAPKRLVPDIPKGALNFFIGSMDDLFYIARGEDGTRYLYTDRVVTPTQIIEAKMRDEAVAAAFTSDFNGKTLPIIKSPTFSDLYARYTKALRK